MKKEFKDYMKEIDLLKKQYNLSIQDVFLLQVAASFELEGMNYSKLKERLCE